MSSHPSRKDAIIVGIEAHVCALQSTYDLIERGVREQKHSASKVTNGF